jgi:aspartate/methionine/tyrosine aminotransferase
MFSNRTPPHLASNRLSRALAEHRAQGRPLIDLTESNPTRAGFAYHDGLLSPLADPRALRYDPQPFGLSDARRAVADEYARHGFALPPERVVLTASTSDAYSLLFKLLAAAGDEVLVPRPSYPLFEHLTALDLVVAQPYDLEYHGRWSIDFDSVERAITPRTRAVLVVSPNNPTGSFITCSELDRLAAICRGHEIPIIADEVFADYELEPESRAGAGRVLARADVLSFTLGGLSKSVGLPQVKLGWIVASGPSAALATAMDRLELVCDTYLAVGTPVQVAADRLLTSGAAIRRQIASRVVENYRQLQALAACAPACRVLRADAGWYAVMHVPRLESEEDLVLGLLTRHDLLTHPGYFFDFPRESFLIVSLLPPRDTFADGIGRLLRHFDCSPATQ